MRIAPRSAVKVGEHKLAVFGDEVARRKVFLRMRLDGRAARQEEPEEPSVHEAGNHLVRAALSFMKEHCTEQHLSLGEVADHVYVSQWHLSKLLNRETGQSFFDLLGALRINMAKEMLSDPSVRIHEVSEATGFSDVGHFSRTFKRFAGCTPGEYRKQQE